MGKNSEVMVLLMYAREETHFGDLGHMNTMMLLVLTAQVNPCIPKGPSNLPLLPPGGNSLGFPHSVENQRS